MMDLSKWSQSWCNCQEKGYCIRNHLFVPMDLITIKTPNPKCRLYLFNRVYVLEIQSVMSALWTIAPLTFTLVSFPYIFFRINQRQTAFYKTAYSQRSSAITPRPCVCWQYSESIKWYIEDQAFSPIVWFGSSPAPFPSLPSCHRSSLLTGEGGGSKS